MNPNMGWRWCSRCRCFLSNSPEYFMIKNPNEKNKKEKIVKLVCSISFSAILIQKSYYTKEVLWFVH